MDSGIPEYRCGFRLSPEDLGGKIDENYAEDTARWFVEGRISSCCRRTWKSSDRCIWHVDKDNKPIKELERTRGQAEDPLDGVTIRGVEFGGDNSFSNCRMRGADLRFSSLWSVEFNNTNLYGANLEGAKLNGAEFNHADIRYGILSGADLRLADLSNAYLIGSQLQESELREANFEGANLSWANFSGANMPESDLSNLRLESTDFSNCNLLNSIFYECMAVSANFSQADLRGANFSEASLMSAEFSNAKLKWATFENATLLSAGFKGAEMEESKLIKCPLQQANFSSSSLEGSELQDSNLSSAILEEANLHLANLENSDMEGAIIRNSDLSGVNFKGASLYNADLTRVDIEDSSIVRTDLRKATLQNARLYQAHFSDIRINSDTEFGDTSWYENPDCNINTNNDDDWPWDDTPNDAAVWTYRRLEDLHEQYAQIERARHYHRKKEDARKRQHWENGNYAKWAVYAVNGVLSRHGESPWRVVGASLATVVICGFIYPFIGGMSRSTAGQNPVAFDVLPTIPINAPEPVAILLSNIYFSAVTFTTLGYGDIQPASSAAEALATVESFVGALLMALLVFVLGRRTNW